MGRPRLLDLFCGAGGCSVGYHRAGFDVVGVDIKRMKRYPFEFIQADAIVLLSDLLGEHADDGRVVERGDELVGDGVGVAPVVVGGFDIQVDKNRAGCSGRHGSSLVGGPEYAQPAIHVKDFDAIHASPPCQDHSVTKNFTTSTHGTGWMLAETRRLLQATGLPWVIENVPGAPMRADYKLCGCMFQLPRLKRERWFETSWQGFALVPSCNHPEPVITVAGHDVPSHQRKFGRSVTLDERKAAMGIDWMGRDELGQAIPPAYTEFIGRELLAQLERAA